MPTRTFSREQAMALTLSGGIPGLLRAGSPVIEAGVSGMTGAIGVYVERDDSEEAGPGGPRVYWSTRCPSMVTSVTGGTVLRLADRTGLFHAVDWLGEGERCPECAGTGRVTPDAAYETCTACVTCGFRRPQYDLLWALRRDVDPAVAIVAVWASVRRVMAGLGPAAGVLGPWQPWHGPAFVRPELYGRPPSGLGSLAPREEHAAYDAATLAAAALLLDGTGDLRLTVEVPE